jgi:hypothetical protein
VAPAPLEAFDFGGDFRGGAIAARYRDPQGAGQCGVLLSGVEEESRQPLGP